MTKPGLWMPLALLVSTGCGDEGGGPTDAGADAAPDALQGDECTMDGDCEPLFGAAPCGWWECRNGFCDVICNDCEDADFDGYGEGAGCAGVDCDDGDDQVHPGAMESCNAVDDDCNGATDEGSDRGCYDGPAETAGRGACHGGTQYCHEGVLGPCIGQVLPGAESCNAEDDDCDGATDEDLGNFVCGLGACQTTVAACVDGALSNCEVTTLPAAETCDGTDEDCDGAVDEEETCGCIHVSPNGLDSNTGGASDPLQTIGAAITAAVAGGVERVCVAAGTGCDAAPATYAYTEDVVVEDGVSLLGAFEDTLWTRSPGCTTEIVAQSEQGVLFPSSVTAPTVLDGFTVSALEGQGETAAVTVEGSTGAVIANNVIHGAIDGETTYGIDVTDGATPLVAVNNIVGGGGTELAVGIRAKESAPIVLDNCDAFTASGACDTSACGGFGPAPRRRIQGHDDALATEGESVAVLLDDAASAYIGRSGLCGRYGVEAVGVRIVGDAEGVVLHGNNIVAGGASVSVRGIETEGCEGAAPWIVRSDQLSGDASVAGATTAAAWIVGDCHPVIEGSGGAGGFFPPILGGFGTNADRAVGIHCGSMGGQASRCVIARNFVAGVRGGFGGGLAPLTVGVHCGAGACARIEANRIEGGGNATETTGLLLEATGPLVARNRILGGCAVGTAIALDADDAFARIENNLIDASLCTGGTDPVDAIFTALRVTLGEGPNEMDVHSNTVFASGNSTTCTDTALMVVAGADATEARSRGIFRNNILHGGYCETDRIVIEADALADPRVLENNDLWPDTADILYQDEGSGGLTAIADVNELGDLVVGGNLAADPAVVTFPTDWHLGAGSACVDSGTEEGAPATDYDGVARPQGDAPDIGAYEYAP